jgi:sec-independent protein translocase protein TatC
MSNGRISTQIDPEDMFADTRMSFGDHLEDLRTHLWRAVKSFLVAMVFALFIGKYVVMFIAAPVEQQLKAFNERVGAQKADDIKRLARTGQIDAPTRMLNVRLNENQLRTILHMPPLPKSERPPLLGSTIRGFENLLEGLGVGEAIEHRNLGDDSNWVALKLEIDDPRFKAAIVEEATSAGNTLKTFNVTEAFFVYFKVSMITGLILASPLIFYHIWAFIAAGLYPHEKKYVNYYLPFSVGLFLAGAAVCQFLVIPKAIEVLLSFNDWMGLEPDLRLSEWLGFAMMMPLIFGLSFQTPLVMLFVNKIGILDVSTFRNYRKIAWFLMAVFAAVITPTVDALSMLFLWVPMGFLYELGIILCAMQPQTPFEDVETPQAEEMVEV